MKKKWGRALLASACCLLMSPTGILAAQPTELFTAEETVTSDTEQNSETTEFTNDVNDAEQYYDNYVSNHEHVYAEEIVVPADCLNGGTKKLTCVLCGISHTETIPPLGHNTEEIRNVVKATCAHEGYTGDVYCSRCQTLMEKGEIEPAHTTHDYPYVINAIEPTCYSTGWTEGLECLTCGKTIKEPKKIPKLPHTKKITKKGRKATCMENGYTDEIVCGVCGASLQDSEIIWALNHKYDKNAKWKKYKVTSTAAYQYKECTRCGEKKIKKYITVQPSFESVWMQLGMDFDISLEITGPDSVKSWSSSNTSIAKVHKNSDGSCKVTAGSKPGNVKIYYTTKAGIRNYVKFTIARITRQIRNVPANKTLKAGKSFTLKPQRVPANSTEKITYKSSNTKIATVSTKGVIKAKKKGTVTITVKSGDVKVRCRVTVK